MGLMMKWALGLWLGCLVWAQDPIGLAAIPHLEGGDASERLISAYVQRHPQIDQIIEPDDAGDLFRILNRMADEGKQVGFLIIAGHGARENPSVKLGKGMIMPDDVNVLELCRELQRSKAAKRVSSCESRFCHRA